MPQADSPLQIARQALLEIIEMNRQHALDQYGDANKAETWSCVKVARKALSASVDTIPEARSAFENWMESPPPGVCSEGSPMAGMYRDRAWQDQWEAFQAGAYWEASAYRPSAILTDHAADAVKVAVLAEREACAKVCEDLALSLDRHKQPGPVGCAEAIRERGTLPSIPLLSDDEMPPLPEPVLYVSPKQLKVALTEKRDHYTPSDESGAYLPVRLTAKGLFTQSVYTDDQLRARDRAVEAAVRKQLGVV